MWKYMRFGCFLWWCGELEIPFMCWFNIVIFVSWTLRGRYVSFLLINGLFGITTCLVVPVPSMSLCEYGWDQIGCCKINLVLILFDVFTNVSAPHCDSIPKVIPYLGLYNVEFLLWPISGYQHTALVRRSFPVLPCFKHYKVTVVFGSSQLCLVCPQLSRVAL